MCCRFVVIACSWFLVGFIYLVVFCIEFCLFSGVGVFDCVIGLGLLFMVALVTGFVSCGLLFVLVLVVLWLFVLFDYVSAGFGCCDLLWVGWFGFSISFLWLVCCVIDLVFALAFELLCLLLMVLIVVSDSLLLFDFDILLLVVVIFVLYRLFCGCVLLLFGFWCSVWCCFS